MNEIQVLEQKLVEFGDYEILAVKTNDGKIRAAVKWVCKGIGLTDDQAKRQVKNIQTDLVVSRSVSNLTLNTNAGLRDVLCIELDFLPLWLAKISITPAMQETNPEAVENLVNYQLKAKDVLARAFLPKVEQDPITLALEAALETRKDVKVIQKEVIEVKAGLEELKDNLVVTSSQAKAINKKVKEKVYNSLGGKSTPAFLPLKSKVFSACWREFKDLFDINEFRDLPRIKFEIGMKFLSSWQPNTTLKFEIEQLNEQTTLF